MSETVQTPEPAASVKPEFHFDDSPQRLETAVERTKYSILAKLDKNPDLASIIANQMLAVNNDIVPGLVLYIAPEDLKYTGHNQQVEHHAARVALFTLASDSLVAVFEPEIRSGLAYPPDFHPSDIQKACEQMNYDGQAPEYSLQFGDHSLRMLSPLALNALSAHHLAHIFRTIELSDSPQTNDRLILLGWLYGYFDLDHPDFEHNRRFIVPAISPEAPACLQELKKGLLSSEGLDTPRLRKLKSFWGDAFGVYWASLKRTEESPVRELDDATVRLVQKKLHGDPHFYLPKRVAHVISQAEFNQHRKRLNISIQEIASQYRGSHASFGELKALFNNEVSHRVFACLGEVKADDLEATTDVLVKTVGLDRCSRYFGPDFAALPDVEKIALIGFSAFVSNGSLIKGSEKAVAGLQRVVIPKLRNHHDVLAAEKARTEDAPPDTAWQNFSAKESIAVAQKARAKLEELTPADGVVSTHHPEALQLVADAEAELANAVEVTQLADFQSICLNVIKQDTRLAQAATAAAVVTTGLATHIAFESDPLNIGSIAINLILLGIGTSAMSAVMDLAKNRDAKQLLYQTRLLGEDITNKSAALKTKLNPEHYKQLSRYYTLLGFMLSAAIIYPHLDQAVNFVKDLLPDSSGKPADAMPLDLQLIEISRATTFVDPTIGNSEKPPAPGKPKFTVIGQHGPLFWVDGLCAASTSDKLTCSNADGEYSGLPTRSFSTKQEISSFFLGMTNSANIIRFNTDRHDARMQVPIGYTPIEVIEYNSGPTAAKYSPWGGLRLSSLSLPDGSLRGVIYRPSSAVYPDSSVSFAGLPNEQVLTPDFFNQPGMEQAKPIYDWARNELDRKGQTDTTNEQILAGIKARIRTLGISYGYQSFDTSNIATTGEVLKGLFASRADGTGLVHNRWICNESAYAMYLIANSLGMEVYMPIGYKQSYDNYEGGFATDTHQILLFRNEAGLFQTFEPTLPSLPGENLPVETPFDQETADRQSLVIALSAAGAVLGGSLSLANVDKLGKLIKKFQKRHTQLLDQAPTASLSAGLQACYWLADGFGSPEYTNLLGSDEAYAAQVAHDALSLALSENRPALSVINTSTVDAAKSEAQIIKDGSLPYWLENPEKTANVIGGGELVLVYLKRQIDQNQNVYTPDQKHKANSLYRILKTYISSAKHRRQKRPS